MGMGTSRIRIRVALSSDIVSIEALLHASDLPTAGVAQLLDNFLVAEEDRALVGVAGLELSGKSALLRSVAVTPGWRAKGLGRQLVARILAEAKARRVSELYLLTTTAEAFFHGLGFAAVERETAPPQIRSTGEFRGLCPASAVLMNKRVDAQ